MLDGTMMKIVTSTKSPQMIMSYFLADILLWVNGGALIIRTHNIALAPKFYSKK
jgi:hypothetical protein